MPQYSLKDISNSEAFVSSEEIKYKLFEGSIFCLKGALERGELSVNPEGERFVIPSEEALINALSDGKEIYCKVEVEIDEKREFIDTYNQLRKDFRVQNEVESLSDYLFDSGKFKLVEGE